MKTGDSVSLGEYALLIDEKNKKWMIKIDKDKKMTTHRGEVNLNDLIDLKYGSQIETHLGHRLWIMRPTLEDFLMKARRPTQIVYPKDLGYLIMKSGIRSGCRVAEAGTGSGALTTLLAWIVQPSGQVYSYEVKKEFQRVAEKNLKKTGLMNCIVFKLKNIVEGFDEQDLDAVFLDLDTPWMCIDKVYDALKGGGTVSVITPTYNQAEKTISAMKEVFIDIETVEILLRKILVRPGKTRPNARMVGYTALLITARKSLRS